MFVEMLNIFRGQKPIVVDPPLLRFLLPLLPFPLPSFLPHDVMKPLVWFTTVLLLSLELVHAVHITPVRGHRQHRNTPTRKSIRALRRQGICNPPTTSSNSTKNPPGATTANGNGGFPSLKFKMPSSVPSSLNCWWSDYKSEVGFLGFSYAVSGCTYLSVIVQSRSLMLCDRSVAVSQVRALIPSRVNSRISEPSSTVGTSACTAHATKKGFSASLIDRSLFRSPDPTLLFK